MPTYKCTAACQHCGTISNPKENTWLKLEDMLTVIDQAAESNYKVVVFTGGEPTLAEENLLIGIERAKSYNMIVRIVTNAHWATEDNLASNYIKTLKESGLNEINFSTGDQHARFVPIENIIRATKYSVSEGLSVAIMIETFKERKITRAIIENHKDFKKIIEEKPKAIIKIHESPWMPLSYKNVTEYEDGMAMNNNNVSFSKGCDSILTTTTIQADGVIGACCGLGMRLIPELHLGKVGEVTLKDADNVAENDFLKRWIHNEGPEKILAWCSTIDPSIKWENMYAHRCQACLRLYKDPKVRKIILENHKEKMLDVLFSEWLIYHYDNEKTENLHESITW